MRTKPTTQLQLTQKVYVTSPLLELIFSKNAMMAIHQYVINLKHLPHLLDYLLVNCFLLNCLLLLFQISIFSSCKRLLAIVRIADIKEGE
jgi:hypothetical protein